MDLASFAGNGSIPNLFKATNQLQVAQNEFQMAKQEIDSRKQQQSYMKPEILRLNNQSGSAQLPSQIHSKGIMQRFRTQHVQEDPYSNYAHRASLNGNLSDQKTPTRHPNTFLYRAHLNLNDASSIAKDDQNLDQFSHHLQNQGAKVSAFYQEDRDSSSEPAEEEKDEELRLPLDHSLTDLQCSETEISQPIMQLMHIHQRIGA